MHIKQCANNKRFLIVYFLNNIKSVSFFHLNVCKTKKSNSYTMYVLSHQTTISNAAKYVTEALKIRQETLDILLANYFRILLKVILFHINR